jgi:hypothetical protein
MKMSSPADHHKQFTAWKNSRKTFHRKNNSSQPYFSGGKFFAVPYSAMKQLLF